MPSVSSSSGDKPSSRSFASQIKFAFMRRQSLGLGIVPNSHFVASTEDEVDCWRYFFYAREGGCSSLGFGCSLRAATRISLRGANAACYANVVRIPPPPVGMQKADGRREDSSLSAPALPKPPFR